MLISTVDGPYFYEPGIAIPGTALTENTSPIRTLGSISSVDYFSGRGVVCNIYVRSSRCAEDPRANGLGRNETRGKSYAKRSRVLSDYCCVS